MGNQHSKTPLKDRLMARVVPDEATGCLNWTGVLSHKGYGLIGAGRGKNRSTHRVAFEIAHGPIPDGMSVCHRCDNRVCVNPDHLFLGTQADNVADMVAKGRVARGTKNASAKLTDADVIEIRSIQGMSHCAIGKRFGVSASHVTRIRSGRKWSHLAQEQC